MLLRVNTTECCHLVTSNFIPPPGAWILDLLTLPTKFLTKRLKELRSVFQSSFNQTPCLKFSTKGPLTLKDLQQLKPSHSECTFCFGIGLMFSVIGAMVQLCTNYILHTVVRWSCKIIYPSWLYGHKHKIFYCTFS